MLQLALQMREQHSSNQSLLQQRRMLPPQTGQLVTTREERLLQLLLPMPASPLWMATQITQATPQETTLGSTEVRVGA